MRVWINIIEVLLFAVGILGFTIGALAVALFAPSQNVTGEAARTVGTLAALIVGWPWFLLGTVALAGSGVITAIDRLRKELLAKR